MYRKFWDDLDIGERKSILDLYKKYWDAFDSGEVDQITLQGTALKRYIISLTPDGKESGIFFKGLYPHLKVFLDEYEASQKVGVDELEVLRGSARVTGVDTKALEGAFGLGASASKGGDVDSLAADLKSKLAFHERKVQLDSLLGSSRVDDARRYTPPMPELDVSEQDKNALTPLQLEIVVERVCSVFEQAFKDNEKTMVTYTIDKGDKNKPVDKSKSVQDLLGCPKLMEWGAGMANQGQPKGIELRSQVKTGSRTVNSIKGRRATDGGMGKALLHDSGVASAMNIVMKAAVDVLDAHAEALAVEMKITREQYDQHVGSISRAYHTAVEEAPKLGNSCPTVSKIQGILSGCFINISTVSRAPGGLPDNAPASVVPHGDGVGIEGVGPFHTVGGR